MAIIDEAVGDGSVKATPSNTPAANQHAFFNVDLPVAFANNAAPIDANAQPISNVASINDAEISDDLTHERLSVGTGNLTAPSAAAYYLVAVGDAALAANTDGFQNTGVGTKALNAVTTPGQNTGVGAFAAWHVTTGPGNTAVGAQSLAVATTGQGNTCVGTLAGQTILTGDGNTCIGLGSDAAATASDCIAIGNGASGVDGGDGEVSIGKQGDFLRGKQFAAGFGPTCKFRFNFHGGAYADTDPTVDVRAAGQPASTSLLHLLNVAAECDLYVTAGDPNGVLSANAGSLAVRVSGATSGLYINRSAVNPGTAWSLVTAVP